MAQEVVRLDPNQRRVMEDLLKGLPNGIDTLEVRTVNKVADKGRLTGVREIAKDINLKSAELKTLIDGPKQKPFNKATFRRKRAIVSARAQGLRLARFLTGKNRPNIGGRNAVNNEPKVKVKPRGRSKPVKQGFLLTLKGSGLPGIFKRINNKLEHLYGPSPSQVWKSEKDKTVAPAMNILLLAESQKELRRMLKRLTRS